MGLYRFGVRAVGGIFRLLRVRRVVTGIDNVPSTGGAVLAATHFGYFEFALIAWVIWLHDRRPIRFMATKTAFDRPVVGSLLRTVRQIPVDAAAGSSAYAAAITALQEGALVGVFPEAGVDASFTIRQLKTGAVRLAAEAGVPVIPVGIWGGQRLMTKGHRVGFFERFGIPIGFAFGAPLTVTREEEPRAATQRLLDELHALVGELQSSYPDDGTGKWWQPRSLGGSALTTDDAAALDARVKAERDARKALKRAGRER